MTDAARRCPDCRADLAGRRLRVTTVVTEFCPNCAGVVRVGDRFADAAALARAAEDALAVEAWLAAECRVLNMRCDPDRSGEAAGTVRWELTGGGLLAGCPAGWVLEAAYCEAAPGVVAVRAAAVEPAYLPDGVLGRLPAVFRDHGLQAHGSRSAWVGLFAGAAGGAFTADDLFDAGPSDGPASSGAETRWGGEQVLAVDRLGPGLLRPVVRRLLAAMRDADVTRARPAA